MMAFEFDWQWCMKNVVLAYCWCTGANGTLQKVKVGEKGVQL